MIKRKAFLVLIVCLGMTALGGKEARAASCSWDGEFSEPRSTAQKILRNCVETAFEPVASAYNAFSRRGQKQEPQQLP